ncbi:hypothetical protein BV20DRAFT_283094 [Pilatotrama ljubarskyi]|nr:hypothetical protein BV20DRAFT_283094 [Pilatotrama ljubarskyi]
MARDVARGVEGGQCCCSIIGAVAVGRPPKLELSSVPPPSPLISLHYFCKLLRNRFAPSTAAPLPKLSGQCERLRPNERCMRVRGTGISAMDEPSEHHRASPFAPSVASVHTTPMLHIALPLRWSSASPTVTSRRGAAKIASTPTGTARALQLRQPVSARRTHRTALLRLVPLATNPTRRSHIQCYGERTMPSTFSLPPGRYEPPSCVGETCSRALPPFLRTHAASSGSCTRSNQPVLDGDYFGSSGLPSNPAWKWTQGKIGCTLHASLNMLRGSQQSSTVEVVK